LLLFAHGFIFHVCQIYFKKGKKKYFEFDFREIAFSYKGNNNVLFTVFAFVTVASPK